uniref:Uncharacterized protein n=1 Tax=Manihot esculenta TaxID=3983 RepID=A0A199UB94_MANES
MTIRTEIVMDRCFFYLVAVGGGRPCMPRNSGPLCSGFIWIFANDPLFCILL